MKFLHLSWVRRLLGRGMNTDIRPELLPDGFYTEGKNVRPTSVDGNTGGVEAIKGEQLLYDANAPLPDSYILIGSAVSGGRLMEFWASPDADSLIRIDGVVVAQSPNIPYRWDRPLQIAVEDRCMGGVVYPADHNSDPLYWAFDELLAAQQAGDLTYFSGYTTAVNSVALGAPVEWPRLTALVDLTSNGLKTGQYVYRIRFRTANGDVTNPGPETPMFSVPEYADTPSLVTAGGVFNAYPGGQHVGGETNPAGTATRYGIEMQFRIDNPYGYSEVEILRRSFNSGGGLTGQPTDEVIARLPLEPGEFSIRTFIDPVDANLNPPELVTTDEALDQWLNIRKPKSVELADNRLLYANFEAGYTEPEMTFTEVDGATVFPVTKKLTTILPDGTEVNDGYANPVNDCYYKRFMSGERYGVGVMAWDPTATKYPVQRVTGAENYQLPNRRDPKKGRSFDYSDHPIYAGTTDCQSPENGVSGTFDAFSQGSLYKNGADAAGNINILTAEPNPYNPWTPRNVGDSDSGYGVKPILSRVLAWPNTTPSSSPDIRQDTGSVWAPMHHSLGIAINGISNIPANAKVITVMRTPPAGRVICQGMGSYLLEPNGTNGSLPATKNTSRFAFSSPDLVSGLVPQTVREDMEANPQNMDFQCVAPLGFYSEPYGYYRKPARVPRSDTGGVFQFDNMPTPALSGPNVPGATSSTQSAYGVDLLSYAGIQHDESNLVNVGEGPPGTQGCSPGSGSDGAPAGNYVTFGAWRSGRPPANQSDPASHFLDWSIWHAGSNNGNFVFTPPSGGFSPMAVSDRGTIWSLDGNSYVYTPGGISTDDKVGFNEGRVRVFHQPFYVINLLRSGANVPEDAEWINTGMSVKIEGAIGVTSGVAESFPLLNERLDDCRPWLVTDYRYVYVRTPGQPEKAWLCVSNFAAADPTAILTDIAANGFWVAPDGTQVYGVYEADNTQNGLGEVSFGFYGTPSAPVPPAGSRIVVKYDRTAPIRTFGGDCTVSPAIHAVVDKAFSYQGFAPPVLTPPAQSAPINLGFLPLPYPGFVRNVWWKLPVGGGNGAVADNQTFVPCMSTLRQWCILWDAETRTPGRLNLIGPNGGNSQSAFPNVHYIARPYEYVSDISGVYPQYATDYPNDPRDKGGIKFTPGYNYDYARQPIVTGEDITVGFDPRIDYCNAIAASNERDPLIEEGPGLRTFLSSNITAISQENGEIKFIASSLGPAGRNIYAWTQKGVCRILTAKNILTGASGEQVSTQSISNYWGEEMWLSRNIGLPDQMWRLLAKAAAPAGESYADSFFWPNRDGFFRMTGDQIIDISDDRVMKLVGPTLRGFPTDYTPQSSAFYDRVQNEVGFSISPQVIPPRPPLIPAPIILPRRLFVYSAELNEWVGEFDYAFDGFAQVNRDIVGMRGLQTYLLGRGYTINGDTRQASVMVPMVGTPSIYKQMERFRVEGSKPDRIEVYDKDMNLIVRQDEAIAAITDPSQAQYWVLRMDSWENWVSAINMVGDQFQPTDLLAQDELFYLKCIWFTEGDKHAVSLQSQLRNLDK